MALLETLHATSLLSPPTPAALSALPPFLSFLSFACAPIGRRFGNPCEHLFPSSRPPSRDPGQPFAGYCIALPPRRCSSSHSPPKVRLRANRVAVRDVWHYWRRCTQRLYNRLSPRKKQLSPQGMFSRGESLSYKGGFAVTLQLLSAPRFRYGRCTRRQSHEWCVPCRGKPVRLACHTRSFRLPCR